MTECSEFDDRKIYLSISLRCLIHHIHSNNHNCICIMQDIKHVSNTLIARLLRSNSKSYVRENCIGISKWHHKIITTPPPPDIAILVKCRTYVPSCSTLNQFDVSLMTLPGGAWIRHVQSMLLSYLLWAGGWLWIMPLSVVMYPCPPQPWEFPESTRNYYTFRSAWIYAKYWTKRSTRIYTKYQWILFLNPS